MMGLLNLLAVIVHLTGIVADSTFTKYLKSEYNDVRFSSNLRVLWNSSLTKCLTTCELTDTCVALGFHGSRTCELSQYRPFNQLANTVTDKDWIIYMKYSETCWPYGFEGIVRSGMCYFWQASRSYSSYLRWAAARDDCKARGANLVCTETLEEHESLRAAIPLSRWWSGYFFKGNEHICNSKPAAYNPFSEPPHIPEACVYVSKGLGHGFVFANCDIRDRFVCQKTWF